MVSRVLIIYNCLTNHFSNNLTINTTDIYVACVSSTHSVCAQNYYIAIVSTIVETSVPEREVEPALALLGPIVEKFVSFDDLYAPKDSLANDQVFISRSYDATSHFETVCDDVKDIWKRLTGSELKVEGKVKREEEDA